MKKIIFIAFLSISVVSSSIAQSKIDEKKSFIPKRVAKQVESMVDKDEGRLVKIFKDIHSHPETGFTEVRTAKIVADQLKSLGFKVKTGIGKTGVVAILKNGNGPVLMYRADMDALATQETTGLPYANNKKIINRDGLEVPAAHLCGHDAHVTWLLGMAKVMTKLKSKWSGTLVLVIQPAEELIEGATAMFNDGLYTTHKVPKPDYLIAMHTGPFTTGTMVSGDGVLEAGTEQLDVTFHGRSSHGSMPQLSIDAGLMAAYAVVQYQAIVSRVLDPRDTGVVTVGAINAGVENNTIPGEAVLKLNFRFFKEEVRKQLFKGVKAISDGIARTYGVAEDKLPTIVRKGYSSPLVNDTALTDRVAANIINSGLIKPKSMIRDFRPITGSEDAHMLVHGIKDVKISYLLVGVASPKLTAKAKKEGKEFPFWNHEPNFQVDLDAIPLGAKIASMIVLDILIK
ncbi:MAG: amidohydrolase [Sulfurimonas sp.]|nr:amidohydrolase [Sulfurimonas sp.]